MDSLDGDGSGMASHAARPTFTRSRSTCMMGYNSHTINNTGTSSTTTTHNNKTMTARRRARADTIFTRRRRSYHVHQSHSHTDEQSTSLEGLDLQFPITRQLNRVRTLLEGSIEEALEKVQCLQAELSSSTDGEEESDVAGGESDDGDSASGDFVHLSSPSSTSSPSIHQQHTSNKEDNETLQAFLDDVYELLSSIRKDLQDNLPSLPSLQLPTTISMNIPMNNPLSSYTFDKKAVYESLAINYEKAQEVLFHLSLYSPLSISLPEFPAGLAASLTQAARGALGGVGGSSGASSAPVTSNTSPTDADSTVHGCSESAPPTSIQAGLDRSNPDSGSSSSNNNSNSSTSNTSYSLPQPPLSAIRSFLLSESAKLSAKLPSRPHLPHSLSDWSKHSFENSSHIISNAIHDARDIIHDEKEKLKDLIHDETEKLRQALDYGRSRLLEFHELPAQWKNNKYILSGYRFIPADRPGELFMSAFKWHNETMNIYTHFLPAAYIIYYIFFIFPTTPLGDPTLNTFYDRSANLSFLLASLACLLLSAAWHLASGCGTYSVFHSCATLDYLGISALISTSIISLTHAAFRCDPAVDAAYNLTTCIFGGLGLYLPWKPWFNQREYKNVRIAFFVLLAGVGAAPVIHMGTSYGASATWQFYGPVLYSLVAYKIGLLFYATDFPEALRPGGLFDTLAHSHQFWHCAIVVAIALHWQALKGMNEAGLSHYSCADKDPYDVQYFMKWLHRRDEL